MTAKFADMNPEQRLIHVARLFLSLQDDMVTPIGTRRLMEVLAVDLMERLEAEVAVLADRF